MSLHQAINNNNNNYYNNNKQACLNPLADLNNNSNSNFGYSGMTHNERGLRAASHVSMEHTAQAHEYNPTCPCPDCQDVLTNFTQYHVLDAYTADHLRFEAAVHAAYGYIPAKGTPYNYVVKNVCVGQDENSGESIFEQQVEYTNTFFFHCHLHQMKPVPVDVKERSYQRFFENNNNNNNNAAVAPSMPAPRNNNNNNNKLTSTVAAPQYNNNNNNNKGLARAFATHQNVYQKNNNNNNYNNNNNNVRRNNNQQSFNNNNNNNNYVSNNFQNYYAAPPQNQYNNNNPFFYTRSDVDQAAQDVAFNNVATLGN